MPAKLVADWLQRDPYGWPLAAFATGYGIGQAAVTVFAGNRAPYSVELLLPTILVVCWVVALGAGGIATLVGKLWRSLYWETSGKIFTTCGLVIYAAANAIVGNPLIFGVLTVLAIGTAVQLRSLVSAMRARGIARRLKKD